MDFVAEEDVVLAFSSPAGTRVRVIPGVKDKTIVLTGCIPTVESVAPTDDVMLNQLHTKMFRIGKS